jgi:hypothetical protein
LWEKGVPCQSRQAVLEDANKDSPVDCQTDKGETLPGVVYVMCQEFCPTLELVRCWSYGFCSLRYDEDCFPDLEDVEGCGGSGNKTMNFLVAVVGTSQSHILVS